MPPWALLTLLFWLLVFALGVGFILGRASERRTLAARTAALSSLGQMFSEHNNEMSAREAMAPDDDV